MSRENVPNESRRSPERLSPAERLVIQSANVIEQQGIQRDGTIAPFFEASWQDDEQSVQFTLTANRMSIDSMLAYDDYTLVRADAESSMVMAEYRYDSYLMATYKWVTNKRGRKVERRCNEQEIAELVGEFHKAPSKLTDAENETFLALMKENDIRRPSRFRRLRELARYALRGSPKLPQ